MTRSSRTVDEGEKSGNWLIALFLLVALPLLWYVATTEPPTQPQPPACVQTSTGAVVCGEPW
jgi:hypothetical protein